MRVCAGELFTESSLNIGGQSADGSLVRIRALASCLVLTCVLLFSAAATASATDNSTYRWRLFLAINEVRTAHGLHPLHLSTGLRGAAQRHSNDMVDRDYFAHTSPTGSTLYRRVAHSGLPDLRQLVGGRESGLGHRHHRHPALHREDVAGQPRHTARSCSRRSYGWVGVGRTKGRFMGHTGAIVWTVDFGHR